MVSSQNGWVANQRDRVASQLVPGTQVKLSVRKDAAGLVLLEFAGLFDRLVEDIDNARGALDDWGYAERPIRGGTQLSNHASGTAIDLNATRHPLGKVGTFNATQTAKIRELIRVAGCLRWGGDYVGRKDEMHVELSDGSTLSQCEAGLAALRKYSGSAPVSAKPSADGSAVLKVGSTGPEVKRLQETLNRIYPAYSKLVVDSLFGSATDRVVREFQRRSGLTVDGIVGEQTRKKLYG